MAGDTRAVTGEARKLIAAGQFAEAIAQLEAAIAAGTDSAGIQVLLGIALVENGDVAAGIEHIEDGVHQQPANAQFLFYLGQAHEKQGDTARAARAYRAARTRPGPTRSCPLANRTPSP